MPYILALYAKQFLEIKLFTFDYQENKSQRTVDKVPMCLPELSFKKTFQTRSDSCTKASYDFIKIRI